jgi:glycosyltransferase involved in cell wall biosynthesis
MNVFPVDAEVLRSRAGPDEPAVSAIVTLYNYADYVTACLDSLRAQTQKQLEIVVIDDVSRDNGLSVVSDWLDSHESELFAYQVLRHKINLGLSLARNTAFSRARAPLVFVMDADNELYPRAIARCVEALELSGADGAYTQLEFFGARKGIGDADFWSRERFKHKNYVDAMALVKKTAWRRVGGYAQLGRDGWEDYDFWCKFIEQDLKCVFVPEILCRYRVHGASMSRTQTNPNVEALIVDMSLRHPWLEL